MVTCTPRSFKHTAETSADQLCQELKETGGGHSPETPENMAQIRSSPIEFDPTASLTVGALASKIQVYVVVLSPHIPAQYGKCVCEWGIWLLLRNIVTKSTLSRAYRYTTTFSASECRMPLLFPTPSLRTYTSATSTPGSWPKSPRL